MGYYSDVAIAIDKETYNARRLLKTVPRVLAEEPFKEQDSAYYWFLTSQKWYDHFDEVKEVMDFLNELDEEVGDVKWQPPWLPADKGPLNRASFGYLRVGEEHGDTESGGEPGEYKIYLEQSISVPF